MALHSHTWPWIFNIDSYCRLLPWVFPLGNSVVLDSCTALSTPVNILHRRFGGKGCNLPLIHLFLHLTIHLETAMCLCQVYTIYQGRRINSTIAFSSTYWIILTRQSKNNSKNEYLSQNVVYGLDNSLTLRLMRRKSIELLILKLTLVKSKSKSPSTSRESDFAPQNTYRPNQAM